LRSFQNNSPQASIHRHTSTLHHKCAHAINVKLVKKGQQRLQLALLSALLLVVSAVAAAAAAEAQAAHAVAWRYNQTKHDKTIPHMCT
jgi:membrane-bound inhibitor of C-type lysozyme